LDIPIPRTYFEYLDFRVAVFISPVRAEGNITFVSEVEPWSRPTTPAPPTESASIKLRLLVCLARTGVKSTNKGNSDQKNTGLSWKSPANLEATEAITVDLNG
jgi:hypothetical protein